MVIHLAGLHPDVALVADLDAVVIGAVLLLLLLLPLLLLQLLLLLPPALGRVRVIIGDWDVRFAERFFR